MELSCEESCCSAGNNQAAEEARILIRTPVNPSLRALERAPAKIFWRDIAQELLQTACPSSGWEQPVGERLVRPARGRGVAAGSVNQDPKFRRCPRSCGSGTIHSSTK